MNEELYKRKGSIEIYSHLLKSLTEEELTSLFSRFFPVDIEHSLFSGLSTYKGCSPDFDLVEEGIHPPYYSAEITLSDEGEKASVKFTKR